ESNPVANWCLSHSGWPALIAFKLALVLLVVGLVALIHRYRPRAGRRVLAFGCAVLLLVVAYSCALAGYVSSQTEPEGIVRVRSLEENNRQLDHAISQAQDFLLLKRRLTDDMLANRITLAQAVSGLASAERGRDPHWLQTLRKHYPGLTDEERLAVHFVRFTSGALENPPAASHLARRLEADLQATYGL